MSIPAVPIPPPPPGNCGAFAHVVSPWGGALANFIAARGLGISTPQGDPRVNRGQTQEHAQCTRTRSPAAKISRAKI